MPGMIGSANPQNIPAMAAAGDPMAMEIMARQQQAQQGGMPPGGPGGPPPGGPGMPPGGPAQGMPPGAMTQSQFGNQQAVPPDVQARRAAMLIELLRRQGR